MAKLSRQFRYKAVGGGADLVPVEILVPRGDRELVLQFAEKLRAKHRAKARRTAPAGGRELRIDDYPQLKLIAWNRPGAETVDERDAFALYERNWRFIERDSLTRKEEALIERLAKKFGHGVLNV